MSNFRLILMEEKIARSGLVPSRTISTVFLALSKGAKGISEFFETISQFDPTWGEFFQENEDSTPLLDGSGDGLLVINWDHHCIESFQEFQPLPHIGEAVIHNGEYALEETIPYQLDPIWQIVDHHFEEKF